MKKSPNKKPGNSMAGIAKNRPLMPSQPTHKQSMQRNVREITYLNKLFNNPQLSRKELAQKAGISITTVESIEKRIKAQMRPEMRKVYFPEFPELGIRFHSHIARSGIVQRIIAFVKANPGKQLPANQWSKEYQNRITPTTMAIIARKARQKLGFEGKIPKGGPRMKYPLQVGEILGEHAKKAVLEEKPVNARNIVLEVARKTRIVISAAGIIIWFKCRKIKTDTKGFPSDRKQRRTSTAASIQLLKNEGLNPGVDFEIPKQRRD